jgi:starch-binding outer membrane protein, SusD/RagB family
MKNIIIITCLLLLSIGFNGCQEDFLDRHPLDQITSVEFFKNPADLRAYMNQFYNHTHFPEYGRFGSDGADNRIGQNPSEHFEGSRTVRNTGGLGFDQVRRINYFFDNYRRIEAYHDFDLYKQFVGEAHFFRALIYFNILKTYGDIQWITTELGTESPELFAPRDPRNFVADNIIASLDTAAMYLRADKTNGSSRINKWMALLLQSRVALYEGTWQKYHNGTPFGVSNPDPNKYFNKAVEAANAVMESGLYNIYSTGNPNADYYSLFGIIKDFSGNPEVMFYAKRDPSIAFIYTGETERNYRMRNPIGNSLTKELADSYLCTDGLPISLSPLFIGNSTVGEEFQNRDPRMLQTFAPPDAVRSINAAGAVENYWSWIYARINTGSDFMCPAGYPMRKGYDPHMTNQVYGNEVNPSIIYRYAEALLNYAEAKAELGSINQADLDKSINKLRDRAGMPHLVFANIAQDPKWDFPELSPIINEVRRERRVELMGEGFRWDDIARWAAANHLIVGKRPRGAKANQFTQIVFPVDEDGYFDPYRVRLPNGYGFNPGRDYLTSIPVQEIVLNPNMTQNPGW